VRYPGQPGICLAVSPQPPATDLTPAARLRDCTVPEYPLSFRAAGGSRLVKARSAYFLFPASPAKSPLIPLNPKRLTFSAANMSV
jgi:hypothetical protein